MWKKAADKKWGNTNNYSNSSPSYSAPKAEPKPTPTPSYSYSERSVATTSQVKEWLGYLRTYTIGWPSKGSIYIYRVNVSECPTNVFSIKVELSISANCKITDSYTEYDFQRDVQHEVDLVCEELSEKLEPHAERLGFDFEIEAEITRTV